MDNLLLGIDNIQDDSISNILEKNLISFYDWGFLNAGGYVNVNRPMSGIYGGNKHILKLVDDPNYRSGQVWQAFRENWIWETGINKTTQPNSISGIYVGNTFKSFSYNPTSGYYVGDGYTLDYPNGRVIFNSPIATNSQVSVNYSYKWISVESAEGMPFFRYIQQGSFRSDENFFTGSGNWLQLGATRVQLPAIFIESPIRSSFKPLQLGGGQYHNADVLVHVITENFSTAKNITDAISFQNDRTINLYNTNGVYKSGHLAIDNYGNLVDKTYSYPYLLDNHYYGKCFINNTNKENPLQLSLSLYYATVRFSTQIELSNIS